MPTHWAAGTRHVAINVTVSGVELLELKLDRVVVRLIQALSRI